MYDPKNPPSCPECGAAEPHWDASKADVDSKNAEIERLRHPWRNVNSKDWHNLDMMLPPSVDGLFWRKVLAEMQAALNEGG